MDDLLIYQEMNRKEYIPVVSVSSILLLYSILAGAGSSSLFIRFIFLISPILVIWLVYSVIRHGVYKGPELKSDEEWGYADKNAKTL
ncbi:MAG TPA: hypothetical protein PKC72_02440 [Chitinophagaceae bacterium]|nr:hypothetical protein [Chitinophagaceae bacterium]